jgi:hypothetical protein
MISVMNIQKISFLVVLALTLAAQGFCQDCKDFHKSNDCYVYVPPDRDFQIYNQAKSTFAEIGKPLIYKVVLYGKKDFIVGVCAEAKYYRQIHFKIIDGITHKVLYDNKDYDYIESFGFTIEKTQPLDLEITVMSKDKAAQASKVCLGIQILWSQAQEASNKK